MKILTKAYNNTDWLNGTDLIIWNLDKYLLSEIKLKSAQMIEHFPNDFIEIRKYNIDFEVYSLTDKDPRIINNFIKSGKDFQIIEKNLKYSGLWEEVKDRLKTPAVSLSGGQQQRLCIARTIAVKPEIILMDEPSSALDPMSTSKIEELIYYFKEYYTIIIVTHNMQQAARVRDQTAFFYLGKLIEYSKTRRMFTNPKEKLTEEYVTGKFG